MMFNLLLVIIVVSLETIRSDFTSSTFELQELLKSEIKFLLSNNSDEKVQEFISKQYPDDHFLRVIDVGDNNAISEHVSHPLNSLGLVRRTALDLNIANISSIDYGFPPAEEYRKACNSIIFLQETYGLNISDLSQGIVKSHIRTEFGDFANNFKSSYMMDYLDMFYLGEAACRQAVGGLYDLGIEWIEASLRRRHDKSTEDYNTIHKAYKDVIQLHDHVLDTRGPFSESHRTFSVPFDKKLRKKKKYSQSKNAASKKVDLPRIYAPLFKISNLSSKHNFMSMCNQGSVGWRSPEMDSKYKCRYQHHRDPFLKLGPLKMEEKNDYPFVVVFRDFLLPREVDHTIELGSKKLERSKFGTTIFNYKSNSGSYRSSKQAWTSENHFQFPVDDEYFGNDGNGTFLHAQDLPPFATPKYLGEKTLNFRKILSPVMHKLSRRISMATRLRLGFPLSDEHYQIANYGLGGQYMPHIDSHSHFDSLGANPENRHYLKMVGGRLATFMGYLTDVQLGGGTAYPLLGLRVDAKKHDGVFWLNLLTDGRSDKFTVHGGCPVAVGSKWIINKWVHYLDQGLGSYPCPANVSEQERFPTFDIWRSYN